MHNRAMIAIVVPSDFADKVRGNRPVSVQVLADGTYNNDTAIIFNYAQQVLSSFNRQHAPDAPSQSVAFELRAWYNPNLQSKFYYVPGQW